MNKSYPKTLKSSRVRFPSLALLEQIREKLKNIRNKRGEFKRKVHYGCYLLCSKSGLRISEAVKFDLSAKNKKGLYRISKPKGKKERYVYVSREIIKELKKNNWKPNQTNRFAFYHFLKKVKKELNISKNIELSPHTFRRAFTTYHAEKGMPLPLLQKLLGHRSIRTTALYWQNIYGDDEPNDILSGKKWLENKEPPKSPPVERDLSLVKTFDKGLQNFPQSPKNPNSDIVRNKPLITAEKPNNQDNPLPLIRMESKLAITNYQPQQVIRQISPKTPEKFFLNPSEKLPIITNQKEHSTEQEILLAKIRNLEEQLKQVQVENKNLKALIKQGQETEAKIIQPLPFKIKN